jgi:hypothetical protein
MEAAYWKKPMGTTAISLVEKTVGEYPYWDRRPVTGGSPLIDGWRDPNPYEREIRTRGCSSGWALMKMHFSTKVQRTSYIPIFGEEGASIEGTSHWDGWFIQAPQPTRPQFPDGLRARAVNEALLKLKNRAPNLAEAFGERRETVRMIGNSLQKLARALRALRRRDARAFFGHLGLRKNSYTWTDLSDIWLQGRYGWMPLLHTIYDSVKFAEDNDLNRPESFKAHVIRRIKDTEHSTKEYTWLDPSGTTCTFACKSSASTTHKCAVRLDYKLANARLAVASQLGFTNPAALLWELTTLSFVADWIFPLGDWLTAIDADLGWTFIGGSRTETTDTRFHHAVQGFDHASSFYDNVIKAEARIEPRNALRDFHMYRTVYAGPPQPIFPRLETDWFNVRRCLDLIALITQYCKR